MHNIVLYCKSFIRDLQRVKLLSESIIKYNSENIPFYISVPYTEVDIFRENIKNAIVISDEEIVNSKLVQNWNSQQIIKSNFWTLGVAKNYLCLDSDSYFIKPFDSSDFIVPDTDICYTVMHEQKELFFWTANKTKNLGFDPMESFKECRSKVMEVFGRKGKFYDFGPSPVLWNCQVWKSFYEKYLKVNNITFSECIKHSSSEFSWYGEYLMASKEMEIYPIEPIFKVFHYYGQYTDLKSQGYSEEHLSKLYLGIIMQSNANLPLRY